MVMPYIIRFANSIRLISFFHQSYITAKFSILYGLGTGYVGGGELTQNIEKMGGEGTSEFIFQAIKIYCGK